LSASACSSKTALVEQLSRLTLPQMTVIALKGGTAFLARQYWVQDGQLRCVSADGQRAFPLEKIDLTETVLVNQERNIDFVLQSRDAVEQ
jgi:hypothetical protein